jgi:hypothetical protein
VKMALALNAALAAIAVCSSVSTPSAVKGAGSHGYPRPRRLLRHLDIEDNCASFLTFSLELAESIRFIRCAGHGTTAPYENVYPRQSAGNINCPLLREHGVIAMNKVAETFWIAAAVILGAALAVVAVPTVAIVCFLAMALPVAVQRVRLQRYCGDFVSPSTRKGAAERPRVPPTIETTYTVVDRS